VVTKALLGEVESAGNPVLMDTLMRGIDLQCRIASVAVYHPV
jgi:hypothetical protein